MAENELLTLAEAGAILKLKTSTMRAWVLRRRIPYCKVGRLVRVIQEVRSKKPREKKKSIAPSALVPMSLWFEFVAMREKLRKPMTPKAAELIHKELARLKSEGQDPVEVLEQSIRNGWQDVFPLKEKMTHAK